MMKRSKEKFWCHVVGTIEGDEKAWETIIREFYEETGAVIETLYSAEYLEQFYEAKKNCITIIPVFVATMNPDTKIKLNKEHTDYRWCALGEAKSLAEFPNQQALYDYVWTNFIDRKPSARMKVQQR